jgi:hypothetical protein
MMVNDGSLGVKQLMAVLLHQDFGMGASKNWLTSVTLKIHMYRANPKSVGK